MIGCLAEKQMTTPDTYPLTHNALLSACNQLTNRHPIVRYDDTIVMRTLASLRHKGLARVIHVPGARGPKHRHVLDEALELDRAELALLAVLALRGPQTVAELRTRTERMHPFASPAEVEATLDRLAARDDPLVLRLERGPGQKEARSTHLLCGEPVVDLAPPSGAAARGSVHGEASFGPSESDRTSGLDARLARLEAAVAEMREALGLPEMPE